MYCTTRPLASRTGDRWTSFHHGTRSGPRWLSRVSWETRPSATAVRIRAMAAWSVSGPWRKRQLRPSRVSLGKPASTAKASLV